MTKKYDLSKIMKAAWACYKLDGNEMSFSECLKASWAVAKKIAAKNTTSGEDKLRKGCNRVIDGHPLYLTPEVVVDGSRYRDGWVVSGKTYEVREELKKMGFRWNAMDRCWYTTNADVARQFIAA